MLENEGTPEFSAILQLADENRPILEKLNALLFRIGQLKGRVLFVIDNAEDLILNDKVNFRNAVRLMLLTCSNMKLVLTSRQRLSSLPEVAEEIVLVDELSMLASMQLFKHMTREIPLAE